MSADVPETDQPVKINPDDLSRLLEIELMQKRAEWQRASARNKNIKSISLVFLLVVILAGLAGFYFVFTRAMEERQQHSTQTAETPGRP